MALPITALRALGCHSCRQWALRSFFASIGGPSTTLTPPPTPQHRPFSHARIRHNEARERPQQDDHILNDINDIATNAPVPEQEPTPTLSSDSPDSHPTDSSSATTPWYLQPEHQLPPSSSTDSPLLARQRLPPLPTNPPPLLHPLMTHLTTDLGLDTLTLLDLRPLDPPPALGANLLMLVGSARSEKHLHVSADRLCRWLRSDPWFLTPVADGLLGRNELKLKMRRRAKRSRLMAGAVGSKSTATGESDLEDGIRTGWVCVNVGRVEGGELPEREGQRARQREGFVGFGRQSAGCNVVVQMMTEEKRGEIDLEKLWMGMLRRNLREQELEREKEGQAGGGMEGTSVGGLEEGNAVQELFDPAEVETGEGSVQKESGMGR